MFLSFDLAFYTFFTQPFPDFFSGVTSLVNFSPFVLFIFFNTLYFYYFYNLNVTYIYVHHFFSPQVILHMKGLCFFYIYHMWFSFNVFVAFFFYIIWLFLLVYSLPIRLIPLFFHFSNVFINLFILFIFTGKFFKCYESGFVDYFSSIFAVKFFTCNLKKNMICLFSRVNFLFAGLTFLFVFLLLTHHVMFLTLSFNMCSKYILLFSKRSFPFSGSVFTFKAFTGVQPHMLLTFHIHCEHNIKRSICTH